MGEADTGFFKVRFIDSPLSNFEIIMIYGTGSYAGGGQSGLNRAGKEGVTLELSRLVNVCAIDAKLGRKLAFCSFSGHETLICLEQTAARLFPRLACIVRFPGGLNFNQVFRIRRRSQGRSGETTPLLET
jgi:hypothetical protein